MLCHLNLATIPGCGQPDFGHNPANTLQVGMVLTYAVSECTPRPGYWDCYTLLREPGLGAIRRSCLGNPGRNASAGVAWAGGNSEEFPWQPRPKCGARPCKATPRT